MGPRLPVALLHQLPQQQRRQLTAMQATSSALLRCGGLLPARLQAPVWAGGRRLLTPRSAVPAPSAGPEGDEGPTLQQPRPLVVRSQPVTRAAAPPPQPVPVEHSSAYLLRKRKQLVRGWLLHAAQLCVAFMPAMCLAAQPPPVIRLPTLAPPPLPPLVAGR